jgi:hypothetical protein
VDAVQEMGEGMTRKFYSPEAFHVFATTRSSRKPPIKYRVIQAAIGPLATGGADYVVYSEDSRGLHQKVRVVKKNPASALHATWQPAMIRRLRNGRVQIKIRPR